MLHVAVPGGQPVFVAVDGVSGARGAAEVAWSFTADIATYIDAAHLLFVGRSASQAEQSRWFTTVRGGNRLALTRALSVSDEWAGVRINDLYVTILGRPADASGRAYWRNLVAGGMRLEDVAAFFFGSDEYFRRNGGTNDGFVRALYRDVLRRQADGGGLGFWRSQLDSGRLDRVGVAAEFYASIESRLDRVRSLYRLILGRDPERDGWLYWAEQLRTIGDVVLAANLAASGEYYNRVT